MIANERTQGLDSGIRLAGLHEREAEIVARVHEGRVQRRCGFEMGNRPLHIAKLLERHAKLELRRRKTRRERNRFAELFDGGSDLTLLPQNEAEVVVRFRMFRTESHRRIERRAGALDVARPPARRAEMILGVEESWLKRDCAREVLERRVGLPKLSADVAETVVRSGKFRRSLKSAFVRIRRAREIPGAFLKLAEQKERPRRIRLLWSRSTLLRGSGDAERAGEEHARCTRRPAEHAAHSSRTEALIDSGILALPHRPDHISVEEYQRPVRATALARRRPEQDQGVV